MGLVVVTGPPGAGKSATADSLADLLDPSALVPGDDFFAFLRNGAIAPWLEAAHAQNTSVLQAAAAAVGRLAEDRDVVYDGVVGPWFLDTFFRATGLAHLHYVVLLPPLEVCLDRVRTRRGHGLTDARVAEHMWKQMRGAAPAPRHVVTDAHRSPSEMAVLVARMVADDTARYPAALDR